VICDHENGYTPLHLAVNKKDDVAIGSIIHILTKKIKDETLTKAVLNSTDIKGNTPLMLAVQNAIDSKTTKDYDKSYNCIVTLIFNAVEGLSNLVDVNIQSESGDTCLMLAATYNLTDIVKLLLRRKDIDVNLANKKRFSSIVYAAYYGNIEIFKLLINHKGINIDIKRNQNKISDRDNILHNCKDNIRSEVEELLHKKPLRNSSPELVDEIPTHSTNTQSRRHSIGGSKNKKTKRRSNKKRKSEKKKIFN